MPGIVGSIRSSGATPSGVGAAMAALCHFPAYRAKENEVDSSVTLGQVWRDGDHSGRDWASDTARGTSIAVNGAVFEHGPRSKRANARALLDRYRRHGVLDPNDFDGSFVVALVDMRKRRVTVFNDHVGTLPVYYLCTRGNVYFAPEAKAIHAAARTEPQLARDGVVSFLNCGYCLGRSTLFEGISCLEPGSALEIGTGSGRAETRRYWKSVYRPHRSLARRAAAEDALHEATRRAHEEIVSDSSSRFELMLSGGWDSRGILGFLSSIGRLPSAALGWGLRKDIPWSDPYLAERLAERFHVPFRFLSYDSDQLLENADTWCRLSELANDNIGWFAEGASALASDYTTDADFSIVGDEAWGWRGHPRTESDARNANLPSSLSEELKACFEPDVVGACTAAYEAQIDRVLESCDSEHPMDRRDFLYLHGRVARFIFALGYYKELAVEIRRPLLSKQVLEVMTQVPRRFRADKNLYISMVGRFFPALAAMPLRRARSLPDWKRDMREKAPLRRFFMDLLDSSADCPALNALLAPAEVQRLKREFFDAPPTPPVAPQEARASAARVLPLRTRQRLRASGLYPGSGDMSGAYPRRGPADIIRCIALITLLDRNLRSANLPALEESPARAADGELGR